MARDFPGGTTTDYLITGASAVYNFNTNVCWWIVFRRDTLTDLTVMAHAGTGSRGTIAGVDAAGNLTLGKEGSGGVAGTATTQTATGIWYAVQVQSTTAGNGKFKRYRFSDGVLAAESITNTQTIHPPSTDALSVGNYTSPTTGLAYNGVIDRVALLQADPTDAEFVAWALTGRLPVGLTYKFYAILWNASPTGDLSGNGNNLTVNGTLPMAVAAPIGLFTHMTPFLGSIVTSPPQFARPTTDTTRDNWEEDDGSTTTIYDQLDEPTADNADYIRTQLSPTSDVYVTKLSPVTDPLVSSGHVLRYRYGKDAAGGQQINLTVELRQDYVSEGALGTLIATWTHTDISSGWTEAVQALSGGEADSITDYTNLYWRVIANAP